MATTTPNFGWPVPTSTDLVKDGATAIESLGDSIDASLLDLKGGTTNQVLAKNSNTDMDFKWVTDATGMSNPMTTTGDTIYSSSGSTPARLGIGSSGQVLTVAGGVPSWATAVSGGMTVLASGNLATGTGTTTLSSISTAYNDLRLIVRNLNGSGNNLYTVRVNGDSGANYAGTVQGYGDSSAINRGTTGQTSFNSFDVPFVSGDQSNELVYVFLDYANTSTRKLIKTYGTFRNANTSDNAVMDGLCGYSGANAAITSISVTYASNVNGGTYILYGVK